MLKKIQNKIISTLANFEKEIFLPSYKQHSIIAISLGLFSFLLIWLYQPWGTYGYRDDYKMLFLLGYGFITSSIYYLSYAIPLLIFRNNYPDKKWNAYHEILAFTVFLIILSLSTQIYHHTYFNISNYSFTSSLNWLVGVFELGFFLFLFLIIWKLQKGKRQEQIPVSDISQEENKTVIIKGNNKNEKFKLISDKIIYLKSDKNYIDLFHENEYDQIDKITIRASLLSMEKQLNSEQFIRIHNSYIVSKKYVSNLFIKNTSYFIHLKLNSDIELPVSRKYRDSLNNTMDN